MIEQPQTPYSQDERTWALLSHISALLSLVSVGLLGPIAALTIWLVKKQESVYVGQQALQSLIYQIAIVVLNWVMWLMIAFASMVVVGICCIPVGIIVSILTIIPPIYAAYACSAGRDFKYPLIAEMAGIK